MDINQIFSLASLMISAAAVAAAVYAAVQSRKAVLSGTYLSEMAGAYTNYLKCVSEYIYHRDEIHRDALSTSLYRTLLFASPEICEYSQDLYQFAIGWSRSGMERPIPVDQKVNELGNLMQDDLERFRKRGHH